MSEKEIRFINVKFVKSASKKEEFIDDDLPKIAIVGRSNVGKSSLINMLTNNKKMAKTSSQPGRTRLVNYFNVNDQFYLVDLPGYGFASASKNLVSSWDRVMNDFFVGNKNLRLVLLLLDSRHMPTDLDKEMLDYLAENEIPHVIVLTKADKLSKSELNNNITKIGQDIRHNREVIIPTSVQKKLGIDKICKILEQYV